MSLIHKVMHTGEFNINQIINAVQGILVIATEQLVRDSYLAHNFLQKAIINQYVKFGTDWRRNVKLQQCPLSWQNMTTSFCWDTTVMPFDAFCISFINVFSLI